MIRRRGRGYDRDVVDRLLTEIADSFEAVWHERTNLYEDVRKLQEQLRREEVATAKLRDEAQRTKADRDALLAQLGHAQANVMTLRAAMEQLEQTRTDRGKEDRRSSAERAGLRNTAEELRKERDRLLEEVRLVGGGTDEERKTRQELVEFLQDALKQVEQVLSNGSEPAARPSKPHERQDGQGQQSPGSASEDKNTAPPSH